MNQVSDVCVQFAYHMVGYHVYSLVLARTLTPGSSVTTTLWLRQGQQAPLGWIEARVDASVAPMEQVRLFIIMLFASVYVRYWND